MYGDLQGWRTQYAQAQRRHEACAAAGGDSREATSNGAASLSVVSSATASPVQDRAESSRSSELVAHIVSDASIEAGADARTTAPAPANPEPSGRQPCDGGAAEAVDDVFAHGDDGCLDVTLALQFLVRDKTVGCCLYAGCLLRS